MPRKSTYPLLFILAATALLVQGCGASENSNAADQKIISETQEQMNIPTPKAPFKTFNVYTDANAPDNHYFSTGWMGDFADLKIDESSTDQPHSGSTCIKITYGNQASQGARWSGVYWQNPPSNWGTRAGGYDLSGAKKLTFWVRGAVGGERIEEFKIGGVTGEHPDTDLAGIGPVVLTTEWKQYSIDLTGKDLSSISGGFAWSTNLDVVPNGCVFYLDDIRYE